MRTHENDIDNGKSLPEAIAHFAFALMASASIGIACKSFLTGFGIWCILVYISTEVASLKDKMEEIAKKHGK